MDGVVKGIGYSNVQKVHSRVHEVMLVKQRDSEVVSDKMAVVQGVTHGPIKSRPLIHEVSVQPKEILLVIGLGLIEGLVIGNSVHGLIDFSHIERINKQRGGVIVVAADSRHLERRLEISLIMVLMNFAHGVEEAEVLIRVHSIQDRVAFIPD